ncbi:MAG: hypothetical protein EBS05_05690 [Proteobacteria bacterium]|nr:hypothetical protein [Pseudomonadota bacterium]
MTDTKKYIRLHAALVVEKAGIEARLSEIAKVLGNGKSTTEITVAKRTRKPFSAATKAKMRAAQQARWQKAKSAKPAGDAPKKA